MKKNVLTALVGLALIAPGSALAVAKGGKLYIKARDAKVLEKADPKAKTIATLQPGAEVVWNGADAKEKSLHAVEFEGKKGFTLQQNLSPNKPSPEFLAKDDGKPIDSQAFASSGAATKALSGAALTYAGAKPDLQTLAKGVITAEGIALTVNPNVAATTPADAKKTGGAK